MLENIQYIAISFGIVLAIVLIFTFNKIRKVILAIFGGSIDKVELGGIVFTIYLGYMIRQEALRSDLSHHVYNELYIFFIAGAAMTGLGLSKVLDTIKEVRLGSSNQTKETQQDEQPK